MVALSFQGPQRQRQGWQAPPPPQPDQSPSSPDAAHNQPDPPQMPDQTAPRDATLQPSVVIQPADQQAAAIQAIADQLARMQKEARDFQATTAKDREADRQEMLRRTAMVRSPTPGPSHQDQDVSRLHPPTVCRALCLHRGKTTQEGRIGPPAPAASRGSCLSLESRRPLLKASQPDPYRRGPSGPSYHRWVKPEGLRQPSPLCPMATQESLAGQDWTLGGIQRSIHGTIRAGISRDHPTPYPDWTGHSGSKGPHPVPADHDAGHLLLPLAFDSFNPQADPAHG